jgi:Head binding
MTQVATINPLNQFFDQPSGLPLTNGKIYIGQVNQDPEQFPITVYWDEAGLVPAIQPIRTTSGYPTRNGSPAILYVNSPYSMRVRNQGDVQVFYIQSAGTTPPVTPTPFIDTGLVPSFASANTFTVTGDQTALFLPGGLPNLRVRATLGSGDVYGTVANAVFGALTTVTLTMDSTSLDASLSAIATSFLAPSPNAIPESVIGSSLRVATTATAAQTAIGVSSARQTVLSGPVDANGYAAFGTTGIGTATLTATGALDLTCVAGGDTNRRGQVTNLQFTSPGGAGTAYLFAAISSTGVVTQSVRTLEQAVINGSGASVTNGQLTVCVQEAIVRVGNGATATQVYEVAVGQCTYSAGVWTGTPTWYALNGRFKSVDTAITAVTATTSFTHNIGWPDLDQNLRIRCISTSGNFIAGMVWQQGTTQGGTADTTLTLRQTSRNASAVTASGSVALALVNPGTGNTDAVTTANFNQFAVISRGIWQ